MRSVSMKIAFNMFVEQLVGVTEFAGKNKTKFSVLGFKLISPVRDYAVGVLWFLLNVII